MIEVSALNAGYSGKRIVKDFNMRIGKGEITTLIGPNGSGKSTVLKTIGRLIKKESGCILLDAKDTYRMTKKEIAQIMACLSQCNTPPEDTTIRELVSFGRHPHRKWYESLTAKDEELVNWAIESTNLSSMQDKRVVNLSGGERQRAWIAVALAQQPKVLLLDEPTTYLDINNQLEVLELVKKLNEEMGLTVVMVLHDLNQAARYSHKLFVIKNGELASEGKPDEVLTKNLIREVYGVEMEILTVGQEKNLIFMPIKVCK